MNLNMFMSTVSYILILYVLYRFLVKFQGLTVFQDLTVTAALATLLRNNTMACVQVVDCHKSIY